MTRFKHFIVAGAGLAVLALAVGTLSFAPVRAQEDGRPAVPVLLTDGAGNTAAVDRQGRVAVQDPRLTFSRDGVRVDLGDRCCPKPSQRFDGSAVAPIPPFFPEGTALVFTVPQGKALLVHAFSTTGAAILKRDGHTLERLAIPFHEPTETVHLQTAHVTYPVGLVFRAGEEMRLETANGVNSGYNASAEVHGVLVADE